MSAPAGRTAGESNRRRPILRILVVEDNDLNRQVATKMIEYLGHSAHCVADGAEAVATVSATEYDLVLMDCQMPVMDGYAAAAAIRRLPEPASLIPIIAMTADTGPGDEEAFERAGMDDFLIKPVVPDVLAEVLARYLP